MQGQRGFPPQSGGQDGPALSQPLGLGMEAALQALAVLAAEVAVQELLHRVAQRPRQVPAGGLRHRAAHPGRWSGGGEWGSKRDVGGFEGSKEICFAIPENPICDSKKYVA